MKDTGDDDDIEFEYESDGDQYDPEVEDDENAVFLENTFYEAQEAQVRQPALALELYTQIVDGQINAPASCIRTTNTWTFKALLSMVLLHIRLGDVDSASARYAQLLPLLQRVSRNEASEAVTAVLEAVSVHALDPDYEQQPTTKKVEQLLNNQQQPHQQVRRLEPLGASSLLNVSDTSSRSTATSMQHYYVKCLATAPVAAIAAENSVMLATTRAEEGDAHPSQLAALTVAQNSKSRSGMEKLEGIFRLTLNALQSHSIKWLWARTCCRMIRLYINHEDYDKAERMLAELRRSCQEEELAAGAGSTTVEAADILTVNCESLQGGQLLEYFSLEMALSLARGDMQRLKRCYSHALKLTEAVANPRIVAFVKEIGAKTHMKERRWQAAAQDFSEAFKAYQEVGRVVEAKTMLRYLVLASLLCFSEIDPFDMREAKALQDDPGVIAMHKLSVAFRNKDLKTTYTLLTHPEFGLSTDPYVSFFAHDVLQALRMEALRLLVLPFSRISLKDLELELKTNPTNVRSLIAQAMRDGIINASIDSIEGVLYVLSPAESENKEEFERGQQQDWQQAPQQYRERQGKCGVDGVWIDAVTTLTAKLNRLSFQQQTCMQSNLNREES